MQKYISVHQVEPLSERVKANRLNNIKKNNLSISQKSKLRSHQVLCIISQWLDSNPF